MQISPVIKAEAASDLRQDVFKISLSLCIYPAVASFLSSTILTVFSFYSGIYGEDLAKAFMQSSFYPIYQVLITLIPLVLCFGALCIVTGRKFTTLIFKTQTDKKTSTLLFFSGSIAIPLTIAASLISQRILNSIGANINSIDIPKGAYATVLFILAHVIIAPIFEELIFRFIILERLRRYGDLFAVISSALFFALLHSSFQSYLPSFIAGIIFSLAAIYTGSVLISILLHFLNNALSVLMLLLLGALSPSICDLIYIAVAGILLIVSLSAFFYLHKKDPLLFEFKFDGKALTTGRKTTLLLFSFSSLVFIVFSLSMAVSSAFL